MSKCAHILEELQDQCSTYHFIHDENTIFKLRQHWINIYARNREIPYLNRYLWHTFSYLENYEFSGIDAISHYERQYPTDLIIFNEGISCVLLVEKSQIPHFTHDFYSDDIYISQKNFKWTFVFTHENSIGPFFCSKNFVDKWHTENIK